MLRRFPDVFRTGGARLPALRVLRVVAALAALALLFQRIPLGEVVAAISEIRPAWGVLALGSALAAELVGSFRLAAVVRAHGLDVPFREVFSVNAAARLYMLALPAGNAAGLALRIHRLTGGTDRYVDAIRSTLLDRVGATTTLVMVGIAAWCVDATNRNVVGDDGSVPAEIVDAPGWLVPLLFGASLLVLLVLHALLVARRPIPGLGPLVSRLERRWPAKLGPLRPSWGASMRPVALTARLWGWSFVVQALGILSLTVLAEGLGLGVSVATLAWARSAALLAATVPISVAGLGVREAVFVVLLGAQGVAAPDALAFSLLGYLAIAASIALLGAYFELRRAVR